MPIFAASALGFFTLPLSLLTNLVNPRYAILFFPFEFLYQAFLKTFGGIVHPYLLLGIFFTGRTYVFILANLFEWHLDSPVYG
jgi:hypothetical protein